MVAHFMDHLHRSIRHFFTLIDPLSTQTSHVFDLPNSLQKVENIFLKNYSKGSMLEGADLTVGDLMLGVTTFHMVTAFGLEKQW